MAEATAAYDIIRNSRSWRMTAPLRAVFSAMRGSFSVLRDGGAGMRGAPRALARRGLMAVLDHVRADARRKERLRRFAERAGPLGARLQRFAAAHPPGSDRLRNTPVAGGRPAIPATDAAGSADAADEADAFAAGLQRDAAGWHVGPRRNG
jgi:hypothetical protein